VICNEEDTEDADLVTVTYLYANGRAWRCC